MEAKLEEARSELQNIVDRCNSKGRKAVALRDEAYEVLERPGLSYIATIGNEHCGTHVKNRASAMLEPQNIATKLRDFARNGFSFPECKRACALERPSGELGDAYEKKTLRWQRNLLVNSLR